MVGPSNLLRLLLVLAPAASFAALAPPGLAGRQRGAALCQTASGSIDRRDALRLAAAAAAGTGLLRVGPTWAEDPADNLPQYDEDGKMISAAGYSEETLFRTLEGGTGGSVQILGSWSQKPDGSWFDPVLGSSASSVRMSAKATELKETTMLGRPEKISLVPALGLDQELTRADLVAAAVRKVSGTGTRRPSCLHTQAIPLLLPSQPRAGIALRACRHAPPCAVPTNRASLHRCAVYYDFDLALPATSCVAELATACLPVKVILLSCVVRAGQLHVLQVSANPDEWRRAGKALRNLRSTFTVA